MIALYRRVLGADLERLAPLVRSLHDRVGTHEWSGRSDVARGTTFVARILCAVMRLPPPGADQTLTVTFETDAGGETWIRRFGAHAFRSRQVERGGRIAERIGGITFLFDPVVEGADLRLRLVEQRVLGVPVPGPLMPQIVTRESEAGGRYHFEVEARLPLVGLLVAYRGWLTERP